MISAQVGIIAAFRGTGHDVQCFDCDECEYRRVVAFADDGEPVVIGGGKSETSGHLVRASIDSRYAGILYSDTGPLDQGRTRKISRLTDWEVAAVDFAALRALELVGKRQLGRSRANRGQLKSVPTWEIHSYVRVEYYDKALDGAYDLLTVCLPGYNKVYQVIDEYVRERIETQKLHDTRRLLNMLANAGCLEVTSQSPGLSH